MKPTFTIDHAGASDRVRRIDEMIARYRRAKRRRLVKRAMIIWRKAEARQAFVEREKPRKLLH